MKLHRPKTLTALLTALASVAFVATNAAHAFTIDPQSGTNPDGSAKYIDPASSSRISPPVRTHSVRATDFSILI
ncbi:MAG: hypothetical protein WCF38_22700 [Pseudolabrys sp.]